MLAAWAGGVGGGVVVAVAVGDWLWRATPGGASSASRWEKRSPQWGGLVCKRGSTTVKGLL